MTQAQLACIHDPRVRDLQSRINAASSSALAIDQAKAVMRMRDGTAHSVSIEHGIGSLIKPMSDDALARSSCRRRVVSFPTTGEKAARRVMECSQARQRRGDSCSWSGIKEKQHAPPIRPQSAGCVSGRRSSVAPSLHKRSRCCPRSQRPWRSDCEGREWSAVQVGSILQRAKPRISQARVPRDFAAAVGDCGLGSRPNLRRKAASAPGGSVIRYLPPWHPPRECGRGPQGPPEIFIAGRFEPLLSCHRAPGARHRQWQRADAGGAHLSPCAVPDLALVHQCARSVWGCMPKSSATFGNGSSARPAKASRTFSGSSSRAVLGP